MSFNLPRAGGLRLPSPRVRLENYKRREKNKEKRPKSIGCSSFHAGHLQKALSLSPSLFISVFIHSGALGRRPSGAPGHSCRVPPGIATRLTPLTQHMEAPASFVRNRKGEKVKSLNLVSYRRGAGEKEEQPQKISADRLRLNY